jgi:hypothetical protein
MDNTDDYLVYGLDVWSGQEEGTYDINDRWEIGIITVLENEKHCDILTKLISGGFLKTEALSLCELRDVGETLIEVIEIENDYPVIHLERLR